MESLFNIKEKIVLITGGAQGMGYMIAEGMVKAGAKVYITSRKQSVCDEAVAVLSEFGDCVGITADLDTPAAIKALAEHFKSCESRLDVLINNAGRTWGALLESFPDDAWEPVMAVNVQSPFTLIRDLLPQLKVSGAINKENPARIINIGSIAGKIVEPIPAYSYFASKAAIHHLTHVLAADLAPHNITVNAVVPGYFPTKMTAHIRKEEDTINAFKSRIPLGRLGSHQDIAGICIYLSSRAGAYATGGEYVIDGGLYGCR